MHKSGNHPFVSDNYNRSVAITSYALKNYELLVEQSNFGRMNDSLLPDDARLTKNCSQISTNFIDFANNLKIYLGF